MISSSPMPLCRLRYDAICVLSDISISFSLKSILRRTYIQHLCPQRNFIICTEDEKTSLEVPMTIGMGSSFCLVFDVKSGGLVLLQDDVNVGPYLTISIPAQQVSVYYTSKAEVTDGCTPCGRLGPCGGSCRDLVSFSSTEQIYRRI